MFKGMRITFIIVVLTISALFSTNDNSPSGIDNNETRAPQGLTFEDQTIYFQSDLIYRATAGDLIPERDGLEFATCSINGILSVHYGSGVSWKTETAHRSYIGGNKGETAKIYSIDSGEILSDREGDEIVAVDEDYSVNLVSRNSNGWSSERLIRDIDWLYEVDIGNLDNDDQNEIIYVGDTREVSILDREGGEWKKITIYEDDFYLDCCFIADIDEESAGNEIITGGGSGTVILLRKEEGQWNSEVLHDFGSPILDIISIDFDPNYPGTEIYASTFDGRIMSLHNEEGEWYAGVIHNEGNLQYCLEYGYLSEEGPSLVIASWNQRIGVVNIDGGYTFTEVFRGGQQMYGCLVADVDDSREGKEIIATDRLGRVKILYRETERVFIDLPFESTSAGTGEKLEIPISFDYKGGLNEIVSISTSGEIVSGFDTNRIEGDSVVILNITSPNEPGSYQLSLNAQWSEGIETKNLKIEVVGRSGSVSMGPGSVFISVGADSQTSETIWAYSDFTLEEPLSLSVSGVPNGLDITLDREVCDPCQNKDYIGMVLSAQTWMTPGNYHFYLLGEASGEIRRAVAFTVNVEEANLKDFIILVPDQNDVSIEVDETLEIQINVISLNGFDGEVSLGTQDVPEQLGVEIESKKVSPTGNSTVILKGLSLGGPFILVIKGSSGNKTRSDTIRVEIRNPPPALNITHPEGELTINNENGEGIVMFDVKLTPKHGVITGVSINGSIVGGNGTLTLDRHEFERLPYALNVSAKLNFSLDDPPQSVTLEIRYDQMQSPEVINILISEYSEEEDGDGEGRIVYFLIPLVILITLIILAIAIFLRFRSSNYLNHQPDNSHEDGKGKRIAAGGKTRKSDHIHGSSLDRMGHRER